MAYYFKTPLDTVAVVAELDETFATNRDYFCILRVDGEDGIQFSVNDAVREVATNPWKQLLVLIYDLEQVGMDYWASVYDAGLGYMRENKIEATMITMFVSLDGQEETANYQFLAGFTFPTQDDYDKFVETMQGKDLEV